MNDQQHVLWMHSAMERDFVWREQDSTQSARRALYPGDPWEDTKEQEKGLRKLDEVLRHPQLSIEFKNELVGEMRRIIEVVPAAADGFDVELLDYSVVVSAKPPLSGGTEIDRAFIFQGAKNIQYRDITGVNRTGWMDAYSFGSTSTYIFAPRELSAIAYVAAEALIRKKYDTILPAAALELSKQNADVVSELKEKLEGAGYYKGVPYDILPTPERLTRADVDNVLAELCTKFDTIDPPPAEPDARRPKALRDRILLWLSQFRTDEHIQYAIDTLRTVRVLGREDTSQALNAFLQKHPEFTGATVVLLGGVKDSTSIQGYYSKDIPDALGGVMTLEEAARRKIEAPVIFLDDFVGSGRQVRDILGNWFDIAELRVESLQEQRELFNEAERDYLLSRKVAFVFVAGWDEGRDEVEKVCAEIKLNAIVHVQIGDSAIPFAFEELKKKYPTTKIEAFKKECERIGKALLASNGKSEDKIEKRNLGYGNKGMLLVSRYNTPTQVLTCLWHPGSVDGVDWFPLLRRRPKA